MSDLFRVEGLTKNFGGLAVSRNISLAMPAGERLYEILEVEYR